MKTCPNCGKVVGLHSSILQGCVCQYSMQAPSQRTWQGLTDEEIKTICSENGWDSSWQSLRFAQAIEAKFREKNSPHKEKNT